MIKMKGKRRWEIHYVNRLSEVNIEVDEKVGAERRIAKGGRNEDKKEAERKSETRRNNNQKKKRSKEKQRR